MQVGCGSPPLLLPTPPHSLGFQPHVPPHSPSDETVDWCALLPLSRALVALAELVVETTVLVLLILVAVELIAAGPSAAVGAIELLADLVLLV